VPGQRPRLRVGSHGDYDRIADHAISYRFAAETAALSGDLDDVEHVIRARLALAACLQQCGWQPPEGGESARHRDEELVAEPNGALEAEVRRREPAKGGAS
jgi:hypothetical protein